MRHQLWPPKKFYSLIVVLIIVTAGLISIVTYLTRKSVVKFGEFGDPGTTTHNAALHLTPGSGTFKKDDTQSVAIQLLTGGETVNAIQATIVYDPQKITVTDILTTNSLCKFFPLKTTDNSIGEATIGCGLPAPGFNQTTGPVAELVLHLNQTGTFSLKFKDSQVLANNGLGTNVLGSTTDAEYQVTDN